MSSSIGNTLKTLLENYSNAIEDGLSACYVFDRNGLIMAEKHTFKPDSDQEVEIMGAISSVVEPTLKRITSETAGFFGSGVFETEDHRLLFTEAGDQAILLTVIGYDAIMNNIMPYTYLVAEKITAFLANPESPVQVSIPNLQLGYDFKIAAPSNSESDAKRKALTDLRLKLIVVGDPAVGKTSIISKFVTQKIPVDYRPTLGISITGQTYSIQDRVLHFLIWDLAGQKFFQRVRKKYYHGAHAAFVMYDSTRRETFDDRVEHWCNDLKSVLPDIPIVIIGNKVDLSEERKVSTTEGEKLAKKLGCSFLETSAKSGENVRDAFALIGIGLFFHLQPRS